MLRLHRFLLVLVVPCLMLAAGRAQDEDEKPRPRPPNPEAKVPTLEWRAKRVFKTDNRATGLSLSPDGKLLAVGDGTDGQLWDTRKGEQAGRFGLKNVVISRVLFSPDGKTLAFTSVSETEVYLFDLGQRKVVRSLKGHNNSITSSDLAFSPDGKLIASASLMDGVTLWDVETGKARPVGRFRDNQRPEVLAFSPDGKTLAVATEGAAVRLFDVAKGDEVRRLSIPDCHRCPSRVVFSPDGRLLALGVWMENAIAVWEPHSGKLVRVHTWPRDVEGTRTDGTNSLAFAADGRTLIAACGDQRVRVWEVASGGLRYRVEQYVRALAVARGGQLLAGVVREKEVCAWDARTCLRGPRPAPLPDADKAWAGLADKDAAAAFTLMRSLTASPRESVPLLDKRLLTVSAVEASVADGLVRDLDADDFDDRDKASRRLSQLGEAARDTLSAALKKGASPEAGRRIKELLGALDDPPDGERLRIVRAVEVLEAVGTPEARRVLKRLAGGEPKALLTREAKAALGRLNEV